MDHVAQLGVTVLAQWFAKRERLGREAKSLGDFVLGHLDLRREFSQRGLPSILQFQAGPGLLQAGQCVTGVHWKTNGATCVGDATSDGLANPPRGVGGELETLTPVELFDSVHQAEVPLLDQIQQRQPRRLVLLSDGDHQPKVGLHERTLGLFTPLEVPLEFPLAGRCESVTLGGKFGPGLSTGLYLLGESDLTLLGK